MSTRAEAIRRAFALPLASGIYVAKRLWKFGLPASVVRHVPRLGKLRLRPTELVDSRLFFFGVWEPTISDAITRHLRPGAVAIDVGANIGYYTLLTQRIVGAAGRVYSVEPAQKVRCILNQNLELNGINNVVVVPYGISNQSERRVFKDTSASGNGGASHFGELSDHGLELRSLREVISPSDLPRVEVIKVDVEGMEVQVLDSLLELLLSLPNRLLIAVEARHSPSMLARLEAFQSSGFRMLLAENDYRLIRYAASRGPGPLTAIDQLPVGQSDLLLIRGNDHLLPSRT